MEETAINVADELEFQKARRNVYALLERIFKTEVTQELLDSLKQNGILNLPEEAKTSDDPYLRAIASGEELMDRYLSSNQASKLDLDRDYAKAFCGAGSTNYTSAFPFESLYTSEARLLMQEARDDVVKRYARHGLGKSKEWKDCEDHLGAELEFLVFLIDSTIEALEQGGEGKADRLAEEQRDFLESHLNNWVPAFADSAAKFARTDFYRGAALVLRGYIGSDARNL